MFKFNLTIGLFDKNTEKQEISTEEAYEIIDDILINSCGLYAYTAMDCRGHYRMASTGRIVSEPSIRVEIAHDDDIGDMIEGAAHTLAMYLNQESIMVERCGDSKIDFIG